MPAMDDWVLLIASRLQYVEPLLLREGITLDFTPDSLVPLEEDARWRFREINWNSENDQWAFEGVAAYVGEVLLRRAGGRWRASDEAEHGWRIPPIEADPALGLAPVSVGALLLEGARDSGGGVVRRAYDSWDRAVTAYQAAHPSWTPTKEDTPGVDPVLEAPEETAFLRTWLATQQAAFPDWVARYGGGVTWDFSAPTVEALGTVVLRELSTADDLTAPANAAFVGPACWYLGETLRRPAGGRWRYRDGDPTYDPFSGRPYVEQIDPEGARAAPVRLLRTVVRQRSTEHLLSWYIAFTE